MPVVLSTSQFFWLILISAAGYGGAAIGMKLTSQTHAPWAIGLVVGGLAVAALTEIMLLRSASLSIIYLVIIGIETLLVLSVAWYLGDRLSGSQIAGCALVLVGVALVSH